MGEPRFMDGRYLDPGHTENVRTGFRCVDGDGLESGDDQTLWRLIDARGSPSRKDAPRGGREEPPRRTGPYAPNHRERRDLTEGADRRGTRKP